jgi:hypothetical protein
MNILIFGDQCQKSAAAGPQLTFVCFLTEIISCNCSLLVLTRLMVVTDDDARCEHV